NTTDGIFGPAALKPTGRAEFSNVPSACKRCKPTNVPGRSAVAAPLDRRYSDACRYGNEAGDVMTIPADGAFEQNLGRNAANHVALTPLGFLQRTARVFPERLSVVHGSRRYTWRQTSERCHRLAGALMARGIGRGDTVAVMAPNIPEMLEAHFGVPMTGAVLNALNVRL